MLPCRRTHPQTGQASASRRAESSPYRRSQHTFVSVPEILSARHGLPTGWRRRFPASAKPPRGWLPATSSPIRPSIHSQISPRPWSCRVRPCRAAQREPSRTARSSPPCARLPGSIECRRPPPRSLRRTRPRCASRNPPAADRQRPDACANRQIREARPSGAVDFGDLLAILLQPRIAQGVFRRADGNNLAAHAQAPRHLQ